MNQQNDAVDIQQVLNTYSMAANLADYEAMVETYAHDGVWELVDHHAETAGRANILAKSREIVGKFAFFVQQNTPAQIRLDGDRAVASSTIRECGRLLDSEKTIEVFGHYLDHLVRTVEGWKFARRRFKVLGMQEYASRPVVLDAQGMLQR